MKPFPLIEAPSISQALVVHSFELSFEERRGGGDA